MDLLSSYDDDTSNISDQQIPASKSTDAILLQSEWENFEKSIGSSSPAHDTATVAAPELPMEIEEINMIKDMSHDSETAASDQAASEKEEKIDVDDEKEEDDDESHLPPGVRKKNRCHSSSSSSSEDEAGKRKDKSHSDTDLSDSDQSDTSQANATVKEVEKEEKEKPKTTEKSGGTSKKSRRSWSTSGSRSRSHSPHRKHRKSSDHSRRSRSRSKSRRRKERKRVSRHSRSRDRRRSKDREVRHRHREQKHSRSRSRSRDRRSKYKDSRNSRDMSQRSRSRERDRRNRSSSPRGGRMIKYGDKVIKAGASFGRPPVTKPLTFKEKMRQQLIKAIEEGGDVSQALISKDGTVICTQTAGTQQVPAPKKPPVPLMANLVTSTAGLTAATITASEAAMQSMLALQKETTEKTGVEIPKYYNPAAINPVKYAEQVQKRKLLWSKTKDKDVNSQWHATTLSSEHDSKSKEKFRKLMGIKQEGTSGAEDEELEMKQKELFEKLDKEYQYARMATHTHRGIGLGFGSGSYQPPSS